MPDTTAARTAIKVARECHRDVMGGMSTAELKLEAAGGLLRPNPLLGDDDPLPYAEDDPVWLEHAEHNLARALTACDALREAIIAAQGEVTDLASGGRGDSRA